MGKKFNINGDCKPGLHYMVNMDARLREIKKMVDNGDYFTINRARQYGKTTTLRGLGAFLERDYFVVSMDFQMMGASKFRDENTFSLAFAKIFTREMEKGEAKGKDGSAKALDCLKQALQDRKEEIELFELFGYLSDICGEAEKPVVLMIDEVDSASNNQVFLDFLAQLRRQYIDRDETAAFQSVILASVYDIKNIRRKIRQEDVHKYNSPWNIAADFLIDMSFSIKDIGGMLEEYEKDCGTGMDIQAVAEEIYNYTSGYPFLVSCICKLMDERIAGSARFPGGKTGGIKEAACRKGTEGIGEPVRAKETEEPNGVMCTKKPGGTEKTAWTGKTEEEAQIKEAAYTKEAEEMVYKKGTAGTEEGAKGPGGTEDPVWTKAAVWTKAGVAEAVKRLSSQKNILFESLTGKLEEIPELRGLIFLLFLGKGIPSAE